MNREGVTVGALSGEGLAAARSAVSLGPRVWLRLSVEAELRSFASRSETATMLALPLERRRQPSFAPVSSFARHASDGDQLTPRVSPRCRLASSSGVGVYLSAERAGTSRREPATMLALALEGCQLRDLSAS